MPDFRLLGLADAAALLPLNTDSYKLSHFAQYPPGTEHVFSYIEARGGSAPDTPGHTVFFGLQILLKETLCRPVAADSLAYAAELAAAHGLPFNVAGWQHIVQRHGGRLPVRIRAVPEGSVVPTGQVLATVENTDPACAWLTSHLETLLLRLWYPTTVATFSHATKATLARALRETGGDAALAGLPFKLHDFGARGVSSYESALIGGLAHLVNFQGTDTLAALLGARLYYQEPMAGFSIPAAEHSTITAWGRDGEAEAYRRMLDLYARPGALLAVVSDSYDLEHAVAALWGGALREQVIASGATVVIRPDSGHPPTVVLKTVQQLAAAFGTQDTAQGYRLLNHVRVIQGDGITRASIGAILETLQRHGFAADNVAFGQGGALLQAVHRDDLGFAMKASAVCINGHWRDIRKDPATDPGKRSKAGRMTLLTLGNGDAARWATVHLGNPEQAVLQAEGWADALRTVFEDGVLLVDDSLAQVRSRAMSGLGLGATAG